jgi:hypothetical protein
VVREALAALRDLAETAELVQQVRMSGECWGDVHFLLLLAKLDGHLRHSPHADVGPAAAEQAMATGPTQPQPAVASARRPRPPPR